jgi:acyl carrier protein
MTDRLHALFADILNLDPANVSDATGPKNTPAWDSLANMILLAGIEETYEVELSSEEITSMKTVGRVREILETRGIVVA